MVQAIWMIETTSITSPIRMMYPVSPVTTPLSMMSALRLGRYRDAIEPMSCRTMTIQIHRV